jgi:hypothetical protein
MLPSAYNDLRSGSPLSTTKFSQLKGIGLHIKDMLKKLVKCILLEYLTMT